MCEAEEALDQANRGTSKNERRNHFRGGGVSFYDDD
jgi:hypothetical protein